MTDRAIEDLFEQYLEKKRQALQKQKVKSLKRPRPPPPLARTPQHPIVRETVKEEKKQKLSPNAYVSHYFQRGCKTTQLQSVEDEPIEIQQPCQSSPTIAHRQVVKFDDIADLCVICCQSFDTTTETEILKPCSHIFHRECIVRWKTENNSCPMCRSKIITSSSKPP